MKKALREINNISGSATQSTIYRSGYNILRQNIDYAMISENKNFGRQPLEVIEVILSEYLGA
jgi:hypothetical protein